MEWENPVSPPSPALDLSQWSSSLVDTSIARLRGYLCIEPNGLVSMGTVESVLFCGRIESV